MYNFILECVPQACFALPVVYMPISLLLLHTLSRMWAALRFRLLPAIKLYLLGFKVLLVQMLNKPLKLPG